MKKKILFFSLIGIIFSLMISFSVFAITKFFEVDEEGRVIVYASEGMPEGIEERNTYCFNNTRSRYKLF